MGHIFQLSKLSPRVRNIGDPSILAVQGRSTMTLVLGTRGNGANYEGGSEKIHITSGGKFTRGLQCNRRQHSSNTIAVTSYCLLPIALI